MDHELLVAGWQLLLALFSGIVIGTERQINNQFLHGSLGIRDFSLIALLAFLSSYLHPTNPLIWPIAFSGVMILGLAIFIFESLQKKDEQGHTRSGVTTILSFPVVFLIASLSVFHVGFWLIATLVFVLLIILELKDQWHQFAATLQKQEVVDFSLLIAIALILTPLIPANATIAIPLFDFDTQHFVFQSLNVVTFWKVILMMSFMSFIAHFITKYIKGRNALLLATFFGGLVSSLATIVMYIRGGKARTAEGGNDDGLYLAYLSASTGSLVKDVAILFAVVSTAFLEQLLFPIATIILLMGALTMVTYARSKATEEVQITDRPIPLFFIFKFFLVFSLVMIAMVLVRFYLGDGWLVVASFVSGLVSSASALVSLGEAYRLNGVGETIVGFGILAAFIASISAKYFVILQNIGFMRSMKFALPILAMIGVGGLSFSLTFF